MVNYLHSRNHFREYPPSARHYLSLFPNNFLDPVDLTKSSTQLAESLEEFEKLLNKSETTEQNVLNFIRDNKAYFILGSLLNRDFGF